MKFLAGSFRIIIWGFIALICAIVLICSAIYLYLGPSLPSVESLKTVQLQTPLRIYSADNKLIEEFGELRRTPLTYEEIPPRFVQALISVEDRSFETHVGVDAKGFIRAVLEFVSSGEKGGGGSTLTQQVAKNFFFSNKKQFTRKFREILLALQMERILTKREIFELYANKMFFGHRAYGIQAAAQVYYDKDINDLTLAEIAMIAGLPQRPSRANPLSYPDAALKRRNKVLSDMLELGYITEPSYQRAIKAPLTAGNQQNTEKRDFTAPWVAEMVREEMLKRYGDDSYSAGFRVYTTINSKLQNAANVAVQRGLLDYDRRHGFRGAYRKVPVDASLSQTEQWEKWEGILSDEPDFGGLSPAIVTQVEDSQLTVLLADENTVTLPLTKLKWAQRYLNHSLKGAAVSKASDVADIGDMVWLERRDNQWLLAQIPAVQGAFVATNPNNGAIQALVGGFDFRQNKYNRVIQAERQPGSNIKPFLYSAALAKGFTPATIMNDSPITIVDPVLETTWRPKNSGYVFDGPIRLREALYRSKNVVSIRILQNIGINYAINYISKFGFDPSKLPNNLTLALGSASITPMKIMEGYSVIANGGYKVTPYVIQRIEDVSGNILFENHPATVCRSCSQSAAAEPPPVSVEPLNPDGTLVNKSVSQPRDNPVAPRIIDENTMYIMNSILRDVIKKGTGRRALSLGRSDIAGKTGTTNDGVDAWFSGFNPDIVATAWVGFDQPQSLGGIEWGGLTALPIWLDFMQVALEGKPEKILPQPSGIVTVRIDPKSGLLARPGQKDAIFEIFPKDRVPTEQASEKVNITVEREPTEEELQQAIEGQGSPQSDQSQITAPELLF
ncbi:penicillin-binding protein 1A [Gynuella sunshinyii]|uniref:Penicillin-binding protein 1A n=1 Tax=Gynuella sunshinyii YC6258 TaxID=1445510 RepID=A0A0C5V0K8_9GAMM|nr:penicillin-binding protein 1A [Gynuella sunshinyii]AJQ93095.1 membrane carboxypeptidase/penicillin-binding protein [Gynuella sunshinyii YC6258]